MSARFSIKDPRNSIEALVDSNGAIRVAAYLPDVLEQGTKNRYRYFSGLLGTNGLDSGITNMNVNGTSTSPTTFNVFSNSTSDIFVTKLLIYVEDSLVTHSGFGGLGPITNGFSLNVVEEGLTSSIITDAKRFSHLIQQTFAERPWGNGTTSFELVNVSGNSDAQVLPFDIGSLVPGGIRIGRGTNTKIEAVVKDDLQGLDEFNIRVAGYKHVV